MKRSTSIAVLSSLCAWALASAAPAQIGSVLRSHLIKPGFAGFVGPLEEFDEFGTALAPLGDLNGDGTVDLAVGATGDRDGAFMPGAIWILFLKPDGTVLAEQKISQTQGGFTGVLAPQSKFGSALACVGDLDGDGLPELATVSSNPNRLWILLLNANGTVKTTVENLYSDPLFVPATAPGNFSGAPLAALGDLDGDGLGDLAIGSPKDSDGAHEAGAVWITRLDTNGRIKGAHKISQTHGGFGGTLGADGDFGSALVRLGDLDGDGNGELGVLSQIGKGIFWVLYLDANEQVASERAWRDDYYLKFLNHPADGPSEYMGWLGDIDGDGAGELAMGWPDANPPGGPDLEGLIAVATPRPDGSLSKKVRISHQLGGMGALPRYSYFGSALAALGDLDGDGSPELAVGASNERASGVTGGGVWILSLATSAVRPGANPLTLSQASEPVFGATWQPTLDCSGHASDIAILRAYSRPSAGLFTSAGEVLVGGSLFFHGQAVHLSGPTPFPVAVPPATFALIDLPLFVQGLCSGAPGPQLSNALDVVVGR